MFQFSNEDPSKPKSVGGFFKFFTNIRFGTRPAAAPAQPFLPVLPHENRAASPEVDYDTVEATASSAAVLAAAAAADSDQQPSRSSPDPTLNEILAIPEHQPVLGTEMT